MTDTLRMYNAEGSLVLMELTAASGPKVTVIAGSLAYHEPYNNGSLLSFTGGLRLVVQESYETIQQIMLNAVQL